MAELASVYDATPQPRALGDITSRPGQPRTGTPGPQARGKWLTASITDDIPAVIAAAFDEAERRDPDHRRPWVAPAVLAELGLSRPAARLHPAARSPTRALLTTAVLL